MTEQQPLTRADIDGVRKRLQHLAEEVADTEDQVAQVFEQLAQTGGDEDGHRRKIAADAREFAEKERNRAAAYEQTSEHD